MKLRQSLILIAILFLSTAQISAQGRKSQWELFGGAAFPLSPQEFKDWYKVGGSIHGQYVAFPSPTVGITFGMAVEGFAVDEDAFLDDFGITSSDASIDAELSITELGIGIRPYLTSAEASSQIFLFGMGTYNVLNAKATVKDVFSGYSSTSEAEEKAWGLAAGAGMEIPAGDRFNIILQGLVRFIFTEEENTNFVGVTAGLAF